MCIRDSRINSISNLLDEVIKLDEQRIPQVRERLKKNVAEMKVEIDVNRFEQELVLSLIHISEPTRPY